MGDKKRARETQQDDDLLLGKDLNEVTPQDTEPDWESECEVCGARPVLPVTGMCGPCTFGEADTAGGNW